MSSWNFMLSWVEHEKVLQPEGLDFLCITYHLLQLFVIFFLKKAIHQKLYYYKCFSYFIIFIWNILISLVLLLQSN